MEEDRLQLLEALRIDHRDDERNSFPVRWLMVFVSLAVIAGALTVWWTAAAPKESSATVAEPPPSTPVSAIPPLRSQSTGSVLDASGYVVARRQATVSSQVTGRVVAVNIDEGQRVAAGDVIARLDDSSALARVELARSEYEHAIAELQAARTALEDAAPIYQRQREQFEAGLISPNDFDTASADYRVAEALTTIKEKAVSMAKARVELALRDHEETIVRAPFDGIVTVKAAQAGEIVSPVSAGGGFTRTGIGTIVDMHSLETEVDVSENFIHRVYPGQRAVVRLNAYPDLDLAAKVITIVPTADRARSTVKVRVGFHDLDERILPQMGARVSFLDDSSTRTDSSSLTFTEEPERP